MSESVSPETSPAKEEPVEHAPESPHEQSPVKEES
jgi:hypothetical protein